MIRESKGFEEAFRMSAEFIKEGAYRGYDVLKTNFHEGGKEIPAAYQKAFDQFKNYFELLKDVEGGNLKRWASRWENLASAYKRFPYDWEGKTVKELAYHLKGAANGRSIPLNPNNYGIHFQ